MREAAQSPLAPWQSISRQAEGVSLGVWIFLVSEVLLFGGLFLGYAVYRGLHPEAWRAAAAHTDVFYGTLNTAILMTSSLTMAMASRGVEHALRRMTSICLLLTAGLGIAFLVTKGFEYQADISKGLLPGPGFALQPATAQLFWAFYWVMTGLHAVHLGIGVGLVGLLLSHMHRKRATLRSTAVEGVALYWHLVDVIWVVLLPLLYLIGRA
ncbi:MAG: cytochrome c oxidase subunit 3 [Gammaproteobacteria bacterium]|nr:cytochrome c oxidase subunit 3 [Gammaproteobacteria bacterium]